MKVMANYNIKPCFKALTMSQKCYIIQDKVRGEFKLSGAQTNDNLSLI